uniref:Uncharacterized protein n=1 Tax=Octopus bimaculoides TaxID=37653 RepID=A0A0L8HPH7_OCTBM
MKYFTHFFSYRLKYSSSFVAFFFFYHLNLFFFYFLCRLYCLTYVVIFFSLVGNWSNAGDIIHKASG